MRTLEPLFHRNQEWVRDQLVEDPGFFERLAAQQSPEYLWIGCSDSRVPANQILGLPPGEVFVHRNVANVVVHTDFNCLAVMQYAVEALQVKHIIVTGHYGCGGVRLAMSPEPLGGLAGNWLWHVREVAERHAARLALIGDAGQRYDRLCELNAVEQVRHVGQTSIVRDAWARGQKLALHGWVYGLKDGLLRDLSMTVEGPDELEREYERAVDFILSSDRG